MILRTLHWTKDCKCKTRSLFLYCHSNLNCVSLGSPPRIAVLTAGYKGRFKNCENKVNVVVVVLNLKGLSQPHLCSVYLREFGHCISFGKSK